MSRADLIVIAGATLTGLGLWLLAGGAALLVAAGATLVIVGLLLDGGQNR